MTMRIGCVGCGNMGGAILAGLARNANLQNKADAYALCGYNRTASRIVIAYSEISKPLKK